MKQRVLILSVSLLTLVGGTLFTVWMKYRPFEMTCATAPQSVEMLPDCVALYDPYRYVGTKDKWTDRLGKFREMPMQDLPGCAEESYRVVWIPSFHNPISVRIWRSGERFYATSKRMSGRGGFDWEKLAVEDTRQLMDDEWLEATRLIRASGIWGRPMADAPPPNDGALWVIESRAHGRSRTYFRRAPDPTFREACVYLVKLTGWKTEIERY